MRELRAELSGIIASAMDGIVTVDSGQRIVLFNEAAEKMFGCSASEVLGEPLDRLIPSEYRSAHREHIEGFGRTHTTRRRMGALGMVYGLRANGERFPIEASISQVEVGGQKLYTVILRDITERVRSAEAISRLAAIVESSDDAIIGQSLDGEIISWNAAAERVFGYTAEEAMGRPISILVPEERAQEIEHVLERVELGERIYQYETSLERRDKQRIQVSLTVSTIKDSAAGMIGTSWIVRDITERKRAEERLIEQAALLNHARDSIILRDLNNRVLFWNEGAERLTGWTAEEAVGRPVGELLYRRDSRELEEATAAVLEKGEWVGELTHLTKSGREVIVEGHWALVRDTSGRPKAILSINTDITEKKALEAQLRRAQRLESIGTLAGGIAHDLNNILSPILLAIHMLSQKFPDEESQRWLKTLRNNADRGADLVKQILTFARGVEGRRIKLSLRHLMKDLLKVLSDTLPKSIEVEHWIAPDLWYVNGDVTQIYQVLMNLCVNARDAMPRGGKLLIRVENKELDETYARMRFAAEPGRFVLLTVADTGVGISAEIIDKIFDPFFTTKEVGQGTGLGLSTALGIIKSHRGLIDVQSEPGKGTTFRIYLPAVEGKETSAEEEERRALPLGHGELILIVDDEEAIREIAKGTLEAHGYRVLTAVDGADAIAQCAARKGEIKAVVLDMVMPLMDGPATINVLVRLDPSLRIIASSGHLDERRVRETAGSAFQSFLPKPYTADALLVALDEALRPRRD